MIPLNTQPISQDVLAEKYLEPGERTIEDLFARVSNALAAVEAPALRQQWADTFYRNMQAGAIGAGRIMAAAGLDTKATLINCFVQPVADATNGYDEHGNPGIYLALAQAAETMRRGGGVGYDFSNLRPKNSKVKGTSSFASGPCSFINVFDASCTTVESAGARRGAQMGVLRIDHPDVLDFITAKRTPGRWNNFNVSVGVSTAFMQAVENKTSWDLIHIAEPSEQQIRDGAHQREDGQWVYQTTQAVELWDTVMKSAYDFAEPGILFLDNINDDNNLYYAETISATNPCVTADTWVMTTNGPTQVQDLIGVRFDALVNGAVHAVDSDGFFKTGHKDILNLQTVEGHSLRLTADHLVRKVTNITRNDQEFEWVEAGKLQAEDKVALHNHRGFTGWGGDGTMAEGYLMGLLVGDGTLTNDRATISVWAPELVDCTANEMPYITSGLFRVIMEAEAAVSTMGYRADFCGFQYPGRNTGEMRMVSAAVRDLAFKVGMSQGNKTITPEVERSSSDFARGFLRGFFDADGSVQGSQAKGVGVRLAQSDLSCLQAAQRMLQRLGINSTIYQERRSEGEVMMPDGKGGNKFYPIQTQHELVISGDNLEIFANLVGFADNSKTARLTTLLDKYQREPNRDRFIATVKSIEPCGTADVYDVTVSDVHAFDANGLYVHNCGEQPLPAYGCCDLGPVILPKFVRNAFTSEAYFDYSGFRTAVGIQVRMLDNVLEATAWPLEEQNKESQSKRRVGVGFTGLGDTLVMLGIKYNSAEGVGVGEEIARTMRDTAYMASVELAKEKGAFPLFDAGKYLQSGFAKRLPEEIRMAIKEHGIRNSHLLSIAPTGTVSLAFADNTSNGIEPAFSWTYTRKKRTVDGGSVLYTVEDHAYRLFKSIYGDDTPLPDSFVSAMDLTASEHIAMMRAVQPYIDTAISKTVNVSVDYPFEDFKNLYMESWKAGLKGCATYRPNDTLGAVLTVTQPKPAVSPEPVVPVVSASVMVERRPEGPLNGVVDKIEYYAHDGARRLYLVVSFMMVNGVERPIEFFMPVGQTGESQQWVTAAMRSLSLAARGGFLEKALEDLRKVVWDRGAIRYGWREKENGSRVPQWHDSEVALLAYAIQTIIASRTTVQLGGVSEPVTGLAGGIVIPTQGGKKCPECSGHTLIKKDGCSFCSSCGYTGSCG